MPFFTGQGAQYVNMGHDLYATQPLFRGILDRCNAVWQALMGRSLLDLIYPDGAPGNNDLLESHPCGQAANFALECALADLWRAWGIEPAVVLGHSLGDFAAAYTAGVLTLEDGLRLVTERGRLMEQAAGTMLGHWLRGRSNAVPDRPDRCDHWGDQRPAQCRHLWRPCLDGAGHPATTRGRFQNPQLDIPVAAHSPMLDPVLDAFEAAVRKITLAPPKLPVVSSMTGQLVTHELTDPRYWRQHLRNTVRFADGVQTLQAQGCTLFLELGPKPTLLGMTQAIFDLGFGILDSPVGEAVLSTLNSKSKILNSVLLPSLHEDRPAWQQMLESLGQLYVHGVEVDWTGFHNAVSGAGTRRRVALPTYPFQRQRYWDELFKPQRPSAPSLRPLINKMTKSPAIKETIFETEFSLAALPFLADHLVYDAVVSPGACQLALLLSTAELTFDTQQPLQVADVILPQALVVPQAGMRTVQAVLTPATRNESGPKYEFQLISFDPGSLQGAATVETATHATGYLTLPATHPAAVDLNALRQTCAQPVDVAAHYEDAAAMQLQLGPSFRWIAELWQGSSDAGYTALGKLYLPDAISSTTGYLLHPGLLDACFQVASVAQAADAHQSAPPQAGAQNNQSAPPQAGAQNNQSAPPQAGAQSNQSAPQSHQRETLLPFAVAALRLYQPMSGDSWWCHVTQVDIRKWDIQLLDQQGQVVAAIDGYEVRAAPPEAVRTGDAWRDWLYTVAWQPRPYFGLTPDYLPTPAQVAQTLQATVPTLWREHGGAQQQHFLTALEDLSIDYVVAALAKAGFLFQPGAQWRTEQIAQKIGVIPHYRRLLARLLAMLTEVNILTATSEGWQVVQPPAPANPQTQVAALQTTYGNAPELTLLTRCGEKLSEVLRGLQEPLDLLFPGGDTSDTNRLYTESPTAKVMNTLVQQVVEQAVQKLPASRGLRIVEIGAGTGGTTAGLLPHLPAAQTDYLFTDISPAFLTKAQERFASYAFIRYQPLNLEQAPADQGFARHQADLILAANVLHATKDLTATLAHVRQLLQPGGQLVLMEGSRRSRLIDLTFGLTDGWWRFADTRTDHPLLTADQWQTLLAANGFQAVEMVEAGGQMVIVASTGSAPPPAPTPQPAATPWPGGAAPAHATAQHWLIFADTQGIGEALAATLQTRGERPILVYADHAYQQTGERCFTIRPDRAEDIQRLLTAAPGNDTDYQVVHLWSLDTPTLEAVQDPLAIAQRSSGHLLPLVQALLQQAVLPSSLWLVTQAAQATTMTDSGNGAASAGVWGMGKVIALEHPELRCVCVDLVQSHDQVTLAAQLGAEITAGFAQERQENQVALRPEARYVARLLPYQAPAPATTPQFTLHADGTYLITGGLGGLGLAVAQWLAEQGARHLLLIGRSQPKAEAQAHLAALTAMGVTVTVAQADVTDQAALAVALQKTDERYPLRGVIHAVGVLDDGALVQQSWSRFVRVLAPKVQGAWHLHTLTQEMPLDFFVLFSSAASLLGNRGQANHAAANAILDAFVHYRRAQGLPALTINWGPWAEIGAAAELMRSHQPSLSAQGISAIAPQQGIQAFAYLLTQEATQVGVVPLNWPKFLSTTKSADAYYSAFVQSVSAPVVAAAAQPVHLRQQLTTTTGAERSHLLLQHLRTAIAKVLRLPTPEQLDLRQGMMEMGMDSLMAVELRNHLGRTLEHPLPSTLIFDYPTLELLHGYLVSELFGAEPEEEPQQPEVTPATDINADDLSDDDIATLLAQAVYAQ
ncbi:MAG: SDR family NAD(P)-dependent oxidoreductase [Caldilineaceae bacterium]